MCCSYCGRVQPSNPGNNSKQAWIPLVSFLHLNEFSFDWLRFEITILWSLYLPPHVGEWRIETMRREAYFLVCAFSFFFLPQLFDFSPCFLTPVSFHFSSCRPSTDKKRHTNNSTINTSSVCVLTLCSQTGFTVGWDIEVLTSRAWSEFGHVSLLIPTVDQRLLCICVDKHVCSFVCVFLDVFDSRHKYLHFTYTRSIAHLPCLYFSIKWCHLWALQCYDYKN